MDFFGTLGVALGLAMLAGINLYLTLFITGLAVRLGWFHDSALANALEGFGHPAVIAVALGLFVVQFIADKIPWVDSLWDSIHTFLKPAGGVLLALTSLGPDAGTFSQLFVAMLALTGSLLTHGVKASTRLTLNTSPEPFSNIGASVAEDLLVIGGYMLIVNSPSAAFFIFALVLGFFIYLTPRGTRAILWLIWKKLRVPAADQSAGSEDLPTKLSADAKELLLDEFGSEEYNVIWCVPCVTGKTHDSGRMCRNLFGDLIAIRERSGKLFFVGSRNFKKFAETIELGGALATHESRFISEGIVIHNKLNKSHANIRFHRGQAELAERIADYLQERIAVADARDPAGLPLSGSTPNPKPTPKREPPVPAPATTADPRPGGETRDEPVKPDEPGEVAEEHAAAPASENNDLSPLSPMSPLSPLQAVEPEGDPDQPDPNAERPTPSP